MTSTMELMNRLKEKFDYTKWHRSLFEGMNVKEFNDRAADYAKSHPFEGNATIIE